MPYVTINDYAGTVIVGLLVSMAALWLVRMIGALAKYTQPIDKYWPWYMSAIIFGLVLGGLYLMGGQSIQFSGSLGTEILLANQSQYGTWAFLGLAILKLLVSAWSKTTGYHGGLYFPSIFVGVALSLFISSLFGIFAGPGITIGAIAAIFMALSIPHKPRIENKDYIKAAVVALLFMVALLPAQLIPLTALAVLTTAFGNKVLTKMFPLPSPE
jgi:H+/Cl- antiporter ClcA